MRTLTMPATVRERLGRLHADEAGLKTLEVVAVLAVAAVVLGTVRFFYYRILNWAVKEQIDAEGGWEQPT